MRGPIFDTSDAGTHLDGMETPPKSFDFPQGITYVNQLILPSMITHVDVSENSIETPSKIVSKKTGLAFGTRIPANTAPTLKNVPKKEPRTASPARKQSSNTSTSFFPKRENNTAKTSGTRSPPKISGQFQNATSDSFAQKPFNRIGSAASTRYEAREDIPEQEEMQDIYEEEKIEDSFNHKFSDYSGSFEEQPSLKSPIKRYSDLSGSFSKDEILPEISRNLSFNNPLEVGDEDYRQSTTEQQENSIMKSAHRKLSNYNQPSYAMAQSIEEEIDEDRYNPNQYTQDSIDHKFFPIKENESSSGSPVPHPTFYAQGLNEATQVRPFTPPFAGLSSFRNLKTPEEYQTVEEEGEEEAVELVYDPVLKCYYDPSTHEYYELND